MTFGFSVTCDYGCSTSDHAAAGVDETAALAELRAAGWFIDSATTYALCPKHHREENASADPGPASPKFYPHPGGY